MPRRCRTRPPGTPWSMRHCRAGAPSVVSAAGFTRLPVKPRTWRARPARTRRTATPGTTGTSDDDFTRARLCATGCASSVPAVLPSEPNVRVLGVVRTGGVRVRPTDWVVGMQPSLPADGSLACVPVPRARRMRLEHAGARISWGAGARTAQRAIQHSKHPTG